MLVLSRRQGESIQVNHTEVTVLEINRTTIVLGFDGDDRVMRSELLAADPPPPPMPLYAEDLDEVPV